jgi:LPXTG-motif cell wall-anchored protein
MTTAARFVRTLAAAVLVSLAMATAATAASGGGHPSAKELWRQYPLSTQSASPAPTESAAVPTASPGARPVAARTPTPAPRRAAGGGGGSSNLWLTALGIVAALALGGWAIADRRRRGGVPPSSPATLNGRPPLPAGARPGSEDGVAALGPVPPARDREWTAEIEWRHDDAHSTFRVVASAAETEESAVLAQSAPLDWPPGGPGGVEAMTDAAAALEISLRAAGWRPLPPGEAWYAKRFAWQPAGAGGRFARSAPWPDGSEELWRCEIAWDSRYVSSRFAAQARPPGGGEAMRTVASSPSFRGLRREPDADSAQQRSAVAALAEALEAAGWEKVGGGSRWYAERFVWRRPGAPPDAARPAPAAVEAS